MKAKFTVTQDEMVIYKEALRDKLIVTLPGVAGKHVMNSMETKLVNGLFELSVEYGKVVRSGKNKKE